MAAPASKHSELIQSLTGAMSDKQAPEFAALMSKLVEIQTALGVIEARMAVQESMAGPSAQTATHAKRAVVAAASGAAATPAAVPKGKKAAAIVAAADAGAKGAAKLPANARLYFRNQFVKSAEVRAVFDSAAAREELASSASPSTHPVDSEEYMLALASYLWDSKKVSTAQKEGMRIELAALKTEQAHSSMPAQLEADV
jgi:hypothetical protein